MYYLSQDLSDTLLPIAGSDRQQWPEIAAHTSNAPIEDNPIDKLLETLKTGDFQTRWDVSKRLVSLGEPIINPLIELLTESLTENDSDWELPWFITRMLGNIHSTEAIEVLVDLLKNHSNEEVHTIAITALAQQGTPALASLKPLLQEHTTRLRAVQVIGQIHSSEGIDLLLGVVWDRDPAIRAAAIETLSHFSDDRIIPLLVHALKDPESQVRQMAISSLGRRSNPLNSRDLVIELASGLDDTNIDVVLQAVAALSRIGTDLAVEYLTNKLEPTLPFSLQTKILQGLGYIASPSALLTLRNYLHFTSQNRSDLALTQEIINIFGRIKLHSAQPITSKILIEFLQAFSYRVLSPALKQSLAMSLGQLGQVEAIPTLINLLADSTPGVKFHTLAALQRIVPEKAGDHLQTLREQEHISQSLAQGLEFALREWSIPKD